MLSVCQCLSLAMSKCAESHAHSASSSRVKGQHDVTARRASHNTALTERKMIADLPCIAECMSICLSVRLALSPSVNTHTNTINQRWYHCTMGYGSFHTRKKVFVSKASRRPQILTTLVCLRQSSSILTTNSKYRWRARGCGRCGGKFVYGSLCKVNINSINISDFQHIISFHPYTQMPKNWNFLYVLVLTTIVLGLTFWFGKVLIDLYANNPLVIRQRLLELKITCTRSWAHMRFSNSQALNNNCMPYLASSPRYRAISDVT